jgi:hypothetical protein
MANTNKINVLQENLTFQIFVINNLNIQKRLIPTKNLPISGIFQIDPRNEIFQQPIKDEKWQQKQLKQNLNSVFRISR